jgi:hypothetical protein
VIKDILAIFSNAYTRVIIFIHFEEIMCIISTIALHLFSFLKDIVFEKGASSKTNMSKHLELKPILTSARGGFEHDLKTTLNTQSRFILSCH